MWVLDYSAQLLAPLLDTKVHQLPFAPSVGEWLPSRSEGMPQLHWYRPHSVSKINKKGNKIWLRWHISVIPGQLNMGNSSKPAHTLPEVPSSSWLMSNSHRSHAHHRRDLRYHRRDCGFPMLVQSLQPLLSLPARVSTSWRVFPTTASHFVSHFLHETA